MPIRSCFETVFVMFVWLSVVPLVAQEKLERYEFSVPAMGSNLEFVVYANSNVQARSAIDAGLAEVSRLSSVLSNYDEESEVSKLCFSAATEPHAKPVPISQDLFRVLAHAKRWHELSQKRFDITIGTLSSLWRTSRKTKQSPSKQAIEEAKKRIGWSALSLNKNDDNQESSVQILVTGLQLDVSGLATGYIVDQVAARIRENGIKSFLVNAGGDICLGDAPPDREGWRIDVAGLSKDSPKTATLYLHNCAVTTSGDLFQFVEFDGKRYSHFIDPITGEPIVRRQSVTVIAETTLDADAGATALAVMGLELSELRFAILPLRTAYFLVQTPDDRPAKQQVLSANEDAWKVFDTGTAASLRGLAAVNDRVAWSCGSQGTVIVSVDRGETWTNVSPEGYGQVEIRSIHAWNADEAVVATAGQPAHFLKTKDRGTKWDVVYRNESPQAFFDGMRFWNDRDGIAFSDPVDRGLLVVVTSDGGETWKQTDTRAIPKLDAGEAGFAASNSSLRVFGNQLAWIGLGGAQDGPSRIFHSIDRGQTWNVSPIPSIPRGPSSGVFSVYFKDALNGVAVGGDYKQLERSEGNIAVTRDGGKTWSKPEGNPPSGFRSAIVWDSVKRQWLCVGPSGADASSSAQEWKPISREGFHSLEIGKDGSIWSSGSKGRVARPK